MLNVKIGNNFGYLMKKLLEIECNECQFRNYCFADGKCRVDLINEKHVEWLKNHPPQQLELEFK